MGIGIVVGCGVKAEPAAAVLHVGFKGAALDFCVRRVVEPKDHVDIVQASGVQIVPVGRGLEVEAVSLRCFGIELQSVYGEEDVIFFNGGGVEGQRMEGGWLCLR